MALGLWYIPIDKISMVKSCVPFGFWSNHVWCVWRPYGNCYMSEYIVLIDTVEVAAIENKILKQFGSHANHNR